MSCNNTEVMRTHSLYMSDRVYQILKEAGAGNASKGVAKIAASIDASKRCAGKFLRETGVSK